MSTSGSDVRLDIDGEPVWRGPLDEWFRSNDIAIADRAAILVALARVGAYHGGGGAQPAWRLTADPPALPAPPTPVAAQQIAAGMLVTTADGVGRVVERDRHLVRVLVAGRCRWLGLSEVARHSGAPALALVRGTPGAP